MLYKSNFLSATLCLNRKEEKAMREETMKLLDILGLTDVKDEIASSLPYGQQRHLEIARALATNPQLLLLDEPAAGMNPQETDELTKFIYDIRKKFNLTVFMIEHHMDLVMDISDRIYVLDFGKLIASGTPEEIQNNQRVIEAYLGYKKMENNNLLELDNLYVSYGGIQAVKGISLTVPKGEIVTLIGANGAGKSTILRAISGL